MKLNENPQKDINSVVVAHCKLVSLLCTLSHLRALLDIPIPSRRINQALETQASRRSHEPPRLACLTECVHNLFVLKHLYSPFAVALPSV